MKRVKFLAGLLATAVLVMTASVSLGCTDLQGETDSTTTTIAGLSESTSTTLPNATTSATAGATTTTTKKPFSPAAMTTSTTSGMGVLVGAPAPKDKLLRGTYTWDIDSNTDGGGSSADIDYHQISDWERYLEPVNGARFCVVQGTTVFLVGENFDTLSLSDLQNESYTTDRISVSDTNPAIDVGSIIAVSTSAGKYAKIEVTGFEPRSDGTVAKQNMRLRYVLYP
jgi:hypothetical protein